MNDELVTITALTDVVVKLGDQPGAGAQAVVVKALRIIDQHLDRFGSSAKVDAMSPSEAWIPPGKLSVGDIE